MDKMTCMDKMSRSELYDNNEQFEVGPVTYVVNKMPQCTTDAL